MSRLRDQKLNLALSILLFSIATSLLFRYWAPYLSSQKTLLSAPKLSYQHKYLFIYSDNLEFAELLGQHIRSYFRQNPELVPQKLYLILGQKHASYSLIYAEQQIINRLIQFPAKDGGLFTTDDLIALIMEDLTYVED